MKKLSLLAARFVPLFAAVVAPAAELGMKAPPLQIAQWVKGQPVDLAASKGRKIYVVEFWATWCPPCRESIPHLTELQKKFKDKGVVFIGISGEEPGVVKPFVAKQGAKMDYTVAVDQQDATFAGYMKAFGIDGIPHSFVVNKDGLIAWEGHPMNGLAEALEQIVAGKYDIEKVKRETKLHERVHAYLHEAAEGDTPMTRTAGRRLLTDAAKFPDLLNELAWEILTDEDIKQRDLELALKAATNANDVSGGKEPEILDTYALALFQNGKTADARKALGQAMANCHNAELLNKLKKRLVEFDQKGK